MRKTILLLICLFTSVVFSFGQKAKVQTAYNYFKEPYQQYDKAKVAIDEAILNEQSAGMAKTWYYRGLIYHALYKNPKYDSLCNNCLRIAYESFRKSIEIDPKNEWVDEINAVRIPMIATTVFQTGVEAFQAKDYNKALAAFESVNEMTPGDTSVTLNAAYSAERGGNYEKAKKYYSKLIEMKYPDEKIYLSLSNIYKVENDTAKALTIIRDGRSMYPDSVSLMLGEINLLLATGKNEEATAALNAATKKDPNNESLYLALGSTYDNLANPRDASNKELPKPKNYNEYLAKAEESYKKGLAINPTNYVLNYNLGAMYFNQAAEMANQANSIKSNVEYEKAKIRFEEKFKEADPFLVKALDNNPRKTDDDLNTYENTLASLKQLYARTGETEKYNKIKAMIEKK